MREIKFRCWDNEQKKMCYKVYVGSDGWHGEYWDAVTMVAAFSDDNDPGNVLMQFTGLHDISKNEIWEGDIIEWFQFLVSDGKQTGKLVREEVKFDAEGLYRVHCLKSNQNIKVLGNVWENPELLSTTPNSKEES